MANTPRSAMSFRLALLFALFGLVPTLAQEGPVRDRDATWVAPAKDASKPNPLTDRPIAARGGRKIFQQRCATCHGEEGRGSSKAPDLTQPNVQAQDDGALFWKISSGNTHAGMPPFSFLLEPQRWQVVLHLRALASGTSGAQ